MKKYFKALVIGLAVSLISFSSFTQKAPRWVSDKGYWVVEGNVHTPLEHTLWFYNNDNVLVYKESVSGVKLDPNKRKVKMKLKKVLESSVLAWEEKKVPDENKNYVASILN